MRLEMTKLIVTFRNFVKLPNYATTHTTIVPPLALAEGKCILDKFLFRIFHSYEM
jgi:hypothetical protein